MLAARLRPRSDRIADRRNGKTSTVAVSMSRARASRSSARARKSRLRTVAAGMDETLSGFLDGHVLDFTHDEDGAEGDRQLVDSALEHAADFCSQRGVGRRLRLSSSASSTG